MRYILLLTIFSPVVNKSNDLLPSVDTQPLDITPCSLCQRRLRLVAYWRRRNSLRMVRKEQLSHYSSKSILSSVEVCNSSTGIIINVAMDTDVNPSGKLNPSQRYDCCHQDFLSTLVARWYERTRLNDLCDTGEFIVETIAWFIHIKWHTTVACSALASANIHRWEIWSCTTRWNIYGC